MDRQNNKYNEQMVRTMNFSDYEQLNEILNTKDYKPQKVEIREETIYSYDDLKYIYDCLIDEQEMVIVFCLADIDIGIIKEDPDKIDFEMEIIFRSEKGRMDTMNIGTEFISHVFSSIHFIFQEHLIKDLKKNKKWLEELDDYVVSEVNIKYLSFEPKKDFDTDKRREKIYDYVLTKTFDCKYYRKRNQYSIYQLKKLIKII